jgi:hypothetical protein
MHLPVEEDDCEEREDLVGDEDRVCVVTCDRGVCVDDFV